MKSILVYANRDEGQEARLQAALDLGRAFDAHLTCLQVTPYDSYVVTDPFGGVYAIPELLETLNKEKAENRAAVEARLSAEGAHWAWAEATGNPAQALVSAGHLADLILVSVPGTFRDDRHGFMGMVGDLLLHARSPVLAMPQGARALDCFAPAMVAWNGTPESSHALRAAVPMLKQARSVQIVTVEEDREFPATQACEYLGWHGLEPVLSQVSPGERTVAEALADEAQALGAGYLAMGAYGHSRFQEAILGGTTRTLLRHAKLPLLLAR